MGKWTTTKIFEIPVKNEWTSIAHQKFTMFAQVLGKRVIALENIKTGRELHSEK